MDCVGLIAFIDNCIFEKYLSLKVDIGHYGFVDTDVGKSSKQLPCEVNFK